MLNAELVVQGTDGRGLYRMIQATRPAERCYPRDGAALRSIIARKPDAHHARECARVFACRSRRGDCKPVTLIAKAPEYAPEDPFITDSLGWVEFRLATARRHWPFRSAPS